MSLLGVWQGQLHPASILEQSCWPGIGQGQHVLMTTTVTTKAATTTTITTGKLRAATCGTGSQPRVHLFIDSNNKGVV